MGFSGDKFKELKKASEPIYKVPKSISETIEIIRIARNGIFEVRKNVFTKAYLFTDINYTTSDEEEKESIFIRYCKFLNSMDIPFKITVNNKNRNMEIVRDNVMFSMRYDGFDEYRKIYNDIIEKGIHQGRQGIMQERYLTITIERKNYEEAKAYFATLEATMKTGFDEMGSVLIPLEATERLRILHDYYRIGEEENFSFDFDTACKVAADYKNDICNASLKYFPDHFKYDNKLARAFFVKKYPTALSDRFFLELTSLPCHSMTSIDVQPIPRDITTRTLQKKYLGIESDIIKQQQTRNKHNDFATDISYMKRQEKTEIEEIMDDVRENDQNLFYVSVTMIVCVDSKEELSAVSESIDKIGKTNGVQIAIHFLKQREAHNTVLPLGVRHINTMRALTSQATAALLPFNVQELDYLGGTYYGINQVSKNINMGNRKKLINGNGFVFGVPGSGKSFFVKEEMGGVLLNTKDDIIVIDPQNEYFDIAKTFHGAVVNMSTYTDNYVNPLALPEEVMDSSSLIAEKGEFMLGICEQCVGEKLNARQKSIIDRCIRLLYKDFLKNRLGDSPIMSDFYTLLNEQGEQEAKDIALSLELFINGSLNIFNHQTNVDIDNRFLVYGIRDLGKELSAISMLVMMENIGARIERNAKMGRATWLYIDEFHVLLSSDYSAKYLFGLWKKVRKFGGLCTGITQNVVDLLQNYTATTILSNSEFVVLLKQAPTDSEKLGEVLNISDAELKYVVHSSSGMGLIKHGNIVVPFNNVIDKQNAFYKLFNTNLHEKSLLGK